MAKRKGGASQRMGEGEVELWKVTGANMLFSSVGKKAWWCKTNSGSKRQIYLIFVCLNHCRLMGLGLAVRPASVLSDFMIVIVSLNPSACRAPPACTCILSLETIFPDSSASSIIARVCVLVADVFLANMFCEFPLVLFEKQQPIEMWSFSEPSFGNLPLVIVSVLAVDCQLTQREKLLACSRHTSSVLSCVETKKRKTRLARMREGHCGLAMSAQCQNHPKMHKIVKITQNWRNHPKMQKDTKTTSKWVWAAAIPACDLPTIPQIPIPAILAKFPRAQTTTKTRKAEKWTNDPDALRLIGPI